MISDDELLKMRACSPLLPPPGDVELVRVIDVLLAERMLRRRLREWLLLQERLGWSGTGANVYEFAAEIVAAKLDDLERDLLGEEE